MRVEKEKHRVSIICHDGYSIRGDIHINPGERIQDFLNDLRRNFIAVTDAEFFYTKDEAIFESQSKTAGKKDSIILNKSDIKWVEEA